MKAFTHGGDIQRLFLSRTIQVPVYKYEPDLA